MMKRVTLILLCIVLLASPLPAQTPENAEAANLSRIEQSLQSAARGAANAAQQRCLANAGNEIAAARQPLSDGSARDAVKHKKNALQWVTWAVKECCDPGDLVSQIGESLVAEGGMDQDGLARLNDLVTTLQKAKKKKAESDFPVEQEMATKEIVNAILDVIDGGVEVKSGKALKWYLNAAATCDQVQELIDDLLDYIANDGRIGFAARDEARKMVDDLYKMKAKDAPFDDIAKKSEEIRKYIDDEFTRVARERIRSALEGGKEGGRPEKPAAAPVTTVAFTALDGDTNVSSAFLGGIDQIKFVAADGSEVKPKEAGANVVVHDDHVTVTAGKGAGVAGIILAGASGGVRLLADASGAPPVGFYGVAPKDGIIDIRNGGINETLNAAASAGPDMALGPPRDATVTVDGAAVRVVATHGSQIAVVASGIRPTAGTSSVVVKTAAGAAASSTCPSWGYNVSLPPAVKTGAWMPITAEVFGLGPSDKVAFKFLPVPGQAIEPSEVVITAAEAVAPVPIAKMMTEESGAQALSVLVTRQEQ